MQHGLRARRHPSPRHGLRPAERHRQRLVVQKQLHVVVNRLLRRKGQSNHKLFLPRSRILKRVSPVEIHFVRAEPQQPFLPVIDMQARRNTARVNLHRLRAKIALCPRVFLSLFFHLHSFLLMPFPRDRRRRLRLRRSPRRSHSPGQSRLRIIRSVENGGPQNGPRHRRASKNECDRRNPLEHGRLCSTLSAALPPYPVQLVLSSTLQCKVQIVRRGVFCSSIPCGTATLGRVPSRHPNSPCKILVSKDHENPNHVHRAKSRRSEWPRKNRPSNLLEIRPLPLLPRPTLSGSRWRLQSKLHYR